jgi:O-antigen ligase
LINLVNHRLVGVGYESFWLGPRLQKVWVITEGLQINEAHSGYVEIFLTLGWIGLALWGALIATGYRNVIAAYRRDPDAGGLRIAWFLAPLITGFTEAAFRMMGLTWIVFLLATANSRWDAARKTDRRGRPTTRQLQWPPEEEPRSVPEEAVARGSRQDKS